VRQDCREQNRNEALRQARSQIYIAGLNGVEHQLEDEGIVGEGISEDWISKTVSHPKNAGAFSYDGKRHPS
jgi:hypothetical protein